MVAGKKRLYCLSISVGMLAFGFMQGCAYSEKETVLFPGVKALLEAFPAGTINSVEEADEALDAVSYENQVLEYHLGQEMDACHQKFLVSACYDEARLRFRQNRAALNPLSIEADRFKRSEKVRLRDQALVDAQQEEKSNKLEREASRRRYEEKEAHYTKDEAVEKTEKTARYADIHARDEASPPKIEEGSYTVSPPSRLKNPNTVLTPAERAKNVRDYESKQLEAEKRQEDVVRRKAETQAKRDERVARENEVHGKKQKVAED
ncbi:MAG: hypothetical protein NC112_03145 [Oxalobacter formigenes]|nr:hypothetical protein [Oxalobacter formigenes]